MKINNNLIKSSIWLILALLLCLLANIPKRLTVEFITFILCINVCSLIFFSFRIERIEHLRKQYLKIIYFFLFGFIVVHFQIYLEYVLDNYKYLGRDYFYDKSIIPKAIVISSIALNSFLLGYLSFKNRKKAGSSLEYKIYSTNILLTFNFLLFIAYLISNDFDYLINGYSTSGVLSGLTGFLQQFYLLTALSFIILKTRNLIILNFPTTNFLSFLRRFNFIFLLNIFLFCVILLISGDRGPIIQIVLVTIGAYVVTSKRKFNPIVLLTLALISISIFSFIAFYRNITETTSFTEKIEIAKQHKNSTGKNNAFSPNTIELASSVRTFHAAIIFTENYSHTYGVFQGYQLLSIIPGFRFLFIYLSGIDAENLVSTKFLTRQIQGKNIDHGLGTTAVADIYLDFGIYGAALGFFGVGWFLRKLESDVFSNFIPSIFSLTLFLIFLSKALYVGRSQILSVFKEGIMVFLIIVAISFSKRVISLKS